jgi:hypothetical protein
VPSSWVRSSTVTLPWAVEEVRGVDAAFLVVAEQLNAADVQVAQAPVGRVEDEEAAGYPFVDVAGSDTGRTSLIAMSAVRRTV